MSRTDAQSLLQNNPGFIQADYGISANAASVALSFETLQEFVIQLNDSVIPSGACNPFGNTSLTNQINQEIRDLKEFSKLTQDPNLFIERLAQAYASIETETKEANTSPGSRLKAISDIREKLSDAQKDVFDAEHAKLTLAFHEVKYRENQYKAAMHPVQCFLDTRHIRHLKNTSHGSVAHSSVNPTTMIVNQNNQLALINVMDWARAKYQLIDESIRERIKIKLISVILLAVFWGTRHELAYVMHKLFYGQSAAANVHPTVNAMAVMGEPSALHAAATNAPGAPTSAPTSECDKILTGIGGAITACIGAIGALAKDCKGDCCDCRDCCDCGNCSSCSTASCSDCNCGACADCVSNACGSVANTSSQLCNSIGKLFSNCFSQIDCSTCCSSTLQMCDAGLTQLLNGLSGCFSDTANVCGACCDAAGNCCCSQSTNNTLVLFNCNGTGSCSCPRCCNNSCDSNGLFNRRAHSEADVAVRALNVVNVVNARYQMA